MKKFFSMLLLLCGALTLSATLIGVNAATIEDDTVTFSTKGYQNQQEISKVDDLPNSTITFSSGSKYFDSGKAIRVYGGKTFTVASKDPTNNITEIALTFGSDDKTNTITPSTGEYSADTKKWSGSDTSVTFTVGGSTGHRRIAGMTISFLPSNTKSFIVTFVDGESTISSKKVAENSKVEKPADLEKVDFIFKGWYKSNPSTDNNAVAWNFETDTVTGDITLYAKWEKDLLRHAIVDTTSFQKIDDEKTSTYAKYNGTHDIDEVAINSNQVMVSSDVLQFQAKNGYLSNTVAISGHIDSIEMEITKGEFTVSTSTSALTTDGTNVVTLNSTNKKMTVENPNDSYFLIMVGGDSYAQVSSIKINYAYVEKTTYAAAFSAGIGAFAPGKGGDVTGEIGTPKTVTLPTQADLSKTAYNYSVLAGWSDGTTTHAPGAPVKVEKDTSFVAVYGAPENITVAQALEIAGLVNTTGTSFKFFTTAIVKSKTDTQVVLYDVNPDETIVAAATSANLANINVGDIVKVEGRIKTDYNTHEKEYYSASFTLVAPAACTNFQAEQTKASLKLEFTGDSLSNVAIRFGNAIAAASYNASATYGVVVSANASDLEGLTKTGIEALVAANKGAQCSPVRVAAPGADVEDPAGNYYQFAAVLENVPAASYTTELYAVMYMIYGDQVFVTAVKSASVKSVATAYKNDAEFANTYSANIVEAINTLAAAE